MVRKNSKTLEKSGNSFSGQWTLEKPGALSIYVWSQGIIAWCHFSESTIHILFMLCYGESKRQHKMVSVISFHTVSLAFEGFRITRISAAHPAFTCSKLSIETLEQGVKYMFKVNNKDSSRSGIFIVNFEHISHLVLVFLLLTLNM